MDTVGIESITGDSVTEISRQQAIQEKELGNKYFNKGQYIDAIFHYSKGIQCDPLESTILCNRAMAYLNLKEYAKAKIDCDLAIALDPSYVKAIYRRAIAYLGMNDTEAAKKNFQRVLELEPSNRQAQDELKKLDEKSISSERVSVARKKSSPKIEILKAAETNSLIVTPVRDPPPEWRMQPMTKITNIEEIRSVGNSAIITATMNSINDDPPATSGTEIIEIPPVPSTSFEFFKCLRSLAPKSADAFGKYFMNIPKEAYKSLFDHLIDSDLLGNIIDTFKTEIQRHSESVVPISHRLLELSQLERFQLAYAFLDDSQKQGKKQALQEIVSKLKDIEEKGDVRELIRKLKSALEL